MGPCDRQRLLRQAVLPRSLLGSHVSESGCVRRLPQIPRERAGQPTDGTARRSVAALSLFVLCLLLPGLAAAEGPRTLLYFWAQGCGDCSRAGQFLDELVRGHPGLEVRRYEVTREPSNLALLLETADRQRASISTLPAFFLDGVSWSGFGPGIAAAIEEALGLGSLPSRAPRADSRPPAQGTLLVAFFHEEVCPSCESYLRAQDLASRVVRLGLSDARFSPEAYSLLESDGQVRFIELRKRGDAGCAVAWAPLLVVGDRCVTGYDAIDAALRELESEAGRQAAPRSADGVP